LTDAEHRRMAALGAAQAFCPSSNLFLGSGAFRLSAASGAGLRVGLATDIGAGCSYSMMRTMADAYRVGQIHGEPLSPMRGWYLATLGGARALHLEPFIGSFETGREADFVALDWAVTPEQRCRQEAARTLPERLFVLMMMGDERNVAATHVLGTRVKAGV
jgi:guanine deaminase